MILLLFELTTCFGLHLTSHISQHGIHGEITFYQDPLIDGSLINRTVYVTVNLYHKIEKTENETWTWYISEFPVDYSIVNGDERCNKELIGNSIHNLDNLFGPIVFVKEETHTYFEFETYHEVFALTGADGVWGRSLTLLGPNRQKACGTITVTDDYEERVAEARFQSPIAGSVYFRWAGSHRSNVTDNVIFTNLVHVTNRTSSKHRWMIYVTDILDSEADKSRDNCNFLQIVFNPTDSSAPAGDLSSRLGKVTVVQTTSRYSKSQRSMFRDLGLSVIPADLLGGRRSLYLVLFDDRHDDSFLACAKIRYHRSVVVKSIVQSDGISGVLTLSQRTRFDPTWLLFNLTSLGNEVISLAGCQIHELPLDPSINFDLKCAQTGHTYNPNMVDGGHGAQDGHAVGDLSGKYGNLNYIGSVLTLWDIFLPLYGPHSIAHRSLVFYRYIENKMPIPWVCGTLLRYKTISHSSPAVPMLTASVGYRYPIAGSITLRQPKDQPWADTTLIIESLVYSDGTSLNDTFEHRWTINEFPPGKDFYNYSKRCLSAGETFNPYKISINENNSDHCNGRNLLTCKIGDLGLKHGSLSIAGSKRNSFKISRKIFTDERLPLSGASSVIGKSFVIFDDHGPVLRGDRLACSRIEAVYRRKAVVRSWYPNGEPGTVSGKVEFLQQTKYDITNIEVSVEGLVGAGGYHIHLAPVQEYLEFPCEDSTLYGHFNPRNVNPQTSPTHGTPDQYETGDLSGKFGFLDNKTTVVSSYNDSTITLFGPESIIGRSIVIHKRLKNRRWVCSSIERGYAPSEARELRAIASFHHPGGFAYGYIRMTQLVYNDGSKSDTVIEVNLRYPGKQDRNLTRNHNWAVYVNPVSVDATVQVLNTRCTAGGYVWNPYYTQLADPLNEDLYRAECGPDNPLRCYVGDVSSRLGTINLGDQRQVFSDGSFPLEGDVSALGRSIVIFTPEKGGDRFACANIAPDKDIIKYVNVQYTSKFVTAQFLEELRDIMGVPEWFITIDTRKTKKLYNENCIQLLLHFKGPEANKLELDFSTLMTTGRLASPSLFIPGYAVSARRKSTISYRPCGSDDPNDDKKRNRNKYVYYSSGSQLVFNFLHFIPLFFIVFK